jgi:hypothetical protein
VSPSTRHHHARQIVSLARDRGQAGHDVEHVIESRGRLVDAIHGPRPLRRHDQRLLAPTHYAYVTDALATFDGVKIEVHSRTRPRCAAYQSVIAGRERQHHGPEPRATGSHRSGRMLLANESGRINGERGRNLLHWISPRLGRLRERLAREELKVRHQARQRPVSHRVHRFGRDVAPSRTTRCS